jgi:serine protease
MENIPGGYFGQRPDMQYMPVSIGEVPAGTYAVQARLYDLGDPDAPPRIFTQTLQVPAPEASGVYVVPRSPGAYESIELVVRADGPIDPSSLRASVENETVRVDFSYSMASGGVYFARVKLVGGLPPGSYRAEAYGANSASLSPPRPYIGNFTVASTSTVVEYYSAKLDHYFITAGPEAAILDDGTAFQRTGQRFKAWLHASEAPYGAAPVCRFHASGPNSHFYTGSADECQMLKALEQKEKSAQPKGQAYPGWQYEGIAFYALMPVNGSCPNGTTPVYRHYNNRWAENDSNHRFTATPQMRFVMSQGWIDEGVVFCSPA